MKVASERARFTERGFRGREFFPHEVLWLPKPYPDAYLNLERRGVSRERVAAGELVQINVYSDWLEGLPDALFTDPAVNWHGQQFGKKGLIAAAGLFLEERTAFVTLLQSDLCQQIFRSDDLKRAASARLNNRFRYWYRVLFNAVLDFARDRGLDTVCSPTAAHIVATTRKQIAPDLFVQIYDAAGDGYEARKVTRDHAEYWEVSLGANADRIVPLAAVARRDALETDHTVICICHDVEENVDTDVAPSECRDALDRMLAIEQSHGVHATYDVLGRIFRDTAPRIAAHGDHALAFHSYDHQLADLTQLRRVRDVDLQVRGYRPPQSKITDELSDYALGYWNFEWLVSSARSFGFDEPRIEHGIVKIPVHLDDWPMQTGELSRKQWTARLMHEVRTRKFVAFGLHDCYARRWLDWYPELLATLRDYGELWTCEQVVNRERLRSALASASDAPA